MAVTMDLCRSMAVTDQTGHGRVTGVWLVNGSDGPRPGDRSVAVTDQTGRGERRMNTRLLSCGDL